MDRIEKFFNIFVFLFSKQQAASSIVFNFVNTFSNPVLQAASFSAHVTQQVLLAAFIPISIPATLGVLPLIAIIINYAAHKQFQRLIDKYKGVEIEYIKSAVMRDEDDRILKEFKRDDQLNGNDDCMSKFTILFMRDTLARYHSKHFVMEFCIDLYNASVPTFITIITAVLAKTLKLIAPLNTSENCYKLLSGKLTHGDEIETEKATKRIDLILDSISDKIDKGGLSYKEIENIGIDIKIFGMLDDKKMFAGKIKNIEVKYLDKVKSVIDKAQQTNQNVDSASNPDVNGIDRAQINRKRSILKFTIKESHNNDLLKGPITPEEIKTLSKLQKDMEKPPQSTNIIPTQTTSISQPALPRSASDAERNQEQDVNSVVSSIGASNTNTLIESMGRISFSSDHTNNSSIPSSGAFSVSSKSLSSV